MRYTIYLREGPRLLVSVARDRSHLIAQGMVTGGGINGVARR